MTTLIRRATQNDAHILAALNQVVHQLHVETLPQWYKVIQADDPDVIAYHDKNLADPNTHVFLAEHDDEAVGYLLAFLRLRPENAFVHSLRDFHIDQMVVKTAYQGQGIGQQLMAAALRTAREVEADVITLGVAAFNQQAISFYEKQGFKLFFNQMWQPLEG